MRKNEKTIAGKVFFKDSSSGGFGFYQQKILTETMTEVADHRLSLHWRSTPYRQQMTEQEKSLAQWLAKNEIPFKYEQLQLIKNNDLAGKEVVHGRKVRKADVLRTVPDFIFEDPVSGEIFLIEVTERKRPDLHRPNRKHVDPKKRVRHLARLANIDCAIIYRDEMEKFFEVFSKNQLSEVNDVYHLHQTVIKWLKIEWER